METEQQQDTVESRMIDARSVLERQLRVLENVYREAIGRLVLGSRLGISTAEDRDSLAVTLQKIEKGQKELREEIKKLKEAQERFLDEKEEVLRFLREH